MAKPFHVSVVSADQSLYVGDVVQIVATAETGELGILANHTPLMASLKPGQVRLTMENGEEEVIYVSGGFIEVQPRQTIILADSAERAEDLDEETVKHAKARAEQWMHGDDKNIDHAKIQMELAQLTAQLAAIRRKRK